MGHIFSVPKPTVPKPLLRLERKPASLATLAGIELSQGHPRAAERIDDLAEALRTKTSTEGWL